MGIDGLRHNPRHNPFAGREIVLARPSPCANRGRRTPAKPVVPIERTMYRRTHHNCGGLNAAETLLTNDGFKLLNSPGELSLCNANQFLYSGGQNTIRRYC